MMVMIRRIFQVLVRSDAIRYGTFPTSADGAAALAITIAAAAVAWTFGAWTQIVVLAGVTVETRIVGFTLENFVGALAQGEVEIGTGTAPAGTLLGKFTIVGADVTLPNPIRVPAGVGLVARYRTSTGAADTVDIKLKTQTGF